jgi:hypothetical protein
MRSKLEQILMAALDDLPTGEEETIGAYLLRDGSGRFRFDLTADELGTRIAFIADSDAEDDRHLLHAGDRLKLIDGNDAFGLSLDEARALVKAAGPMLKLYVGRAPGAPRPPPQPYATDFVVFF